ncbi:MAG: hypothetical protein ACFCU8_03285 [Thermosynechococcaceae cyanobacterium]
MAINSTSGLGIFLAKILILSAVISVAIKAGGPLIPLPPVSAVALLLVLSPTVIMAIALTLRAKL